MSYCSEKKKKRLWKDKQTVWIEDLKKESFTDLAKYSFDKEWTVGDCEQSPFCQIIWGTLISDYFNKKCEKESFKYYVNRYWMKVSDGDVRYRFLFDVMNNPKFNVGIDNPYEHHLIGNFAPIPGNKNLTRSLQFVHRDLNERWDKFLEYMDNHWYSFDMGFSFDDYLEMTYQRMYLEEGKKKSLTNSNIIKALIKERGEVVSHKFCSLL